MACVVGALPLRAQQTPAVLRDFAMGGGNYYLRAPEFVDVSKATFLKAWHHGLEDHLGKLPIFVT
jgi:hypothetical protein